MRIRLQVSEQRSADAERDWLLSEVNKGLTPGRRGLKLLFALIVLLVLTAAILALLPEVRG